jgi:hypothetical protein
MADLTNQYISASYDDLLQIEGSGTVTDGLGVQPGSFVFTDVTASNLNVSSNVNSNLTPGTDATQDLGSPTNRWNNVYATNFSGSFEGDGSNLTGVTATATPAGTTSEVQFRDGGVTGADSDFTYNKTTNVLSINSGLFSGSFAGNGQDITGVISSSYAVTASYAHHANTATTAATASSVDWDNIDSIPGGLISGSAQLENSNFSGSFSGSFQGDGSNLTGIVSAETASYTKNAQTASYVDWSNVDNIPSGILSSSAQIATEISGAFTQDSSSIQQRLSDLEVSPGLWELSGSHINRVSDVKITGSLSVSDHINANVISGSVISASTYLGDGSNLTGIIADSVSWGNIIGVPSDLLSGSAQIATEISGAFTADSSSIENRLTDLEQNGPDNAATASYVEWTDVTNKPTVLSSSAQIAEDISGSFYAPSSSFETRITTLETQTQYSGSFSGSFQGDGSGLTNVSAEWDGSRDGNANITGSFTVSGSGVFVNFTGVQQVLGTTFSGSQYIGNGTNLIFNNLATQFTGSFKGDGSGLYNINPDQFTGIVLLNPTGSEQTISASLAVGGDLTVGGTIEADVIRANTFIVSSSVSNITVNYASGSTEFGDSLDDTHVFTGSIYVTNSLDVDGYINATTISATTLSGSHIGSANLTGSFTGSFYGIATFDSLNAVSASITGSFKGDGSGLTGITVGPAGVNSEIQYNNNGNTGGASGFLYLDTEDVVRVVNQLQVTGSTILSSSITLDGTTNIYGKTTIKGNESQNAGIYVVDNSTGNQLSPLGTGANGIFINSVAGTFTALVKNSVVIGGNRTGDLFTRDNTVYLPYVELDQASGSFSGSLQGEGSGITGIVSSSYAVSSSFAVSASYATVAASLVGGLQEVTNNGATTTNAIDIQAPLTASLLKLGNMTTYRVPFGTVDGNIDSNANFTFNEIAANTLKVPGLSVVDNASFGDVTTDLVFIQGRINDSVDNVIEPANDDTLSWGSPTRRWKIVASSVTASVVSASQFIGDGYNLENHVKVSANDLTGSSYLNTKVVGDNATITVSQSFSGSGYEQLEVKIADRLFDSFIHGESTGWLTGAQLSIVNGAGVGTEFNVTSGSGQIADNTDLNNPVFTFVTWSAFTSQSVDNLGTHDGTFLFIDATGSLKQYPADQTDLQSIKRDEIMIGGLGHTSNTTIQNVIERPLTLMNPINQLEDLSYAIGPFSEYGNVVSANGANLSLDKTAGAAFVFGGNAQTNPKDPNDVITPATTAGFILTALQDEVFAPTGVVIPTDDYDAGGGSPTNIPGTTNWVAARIWHTPKNNLLTYQYAQFYYASEAEALGEFTNENYILNPSLLITGYVAAVIVHQDGETNLNNATIIPQGKFAGSGGGGGISVTTVQKAYNNSVTPELKTDDTRGALTIYGEHPTSRSIEFGSGSVTPTINAWINNAGTASFTQVNATEFVGDIVIPGVQDKQILFGSGSNIDSETNLTWDYNTNTGRVTGSWIVSGSSTLQSIGKFISDGTSEFTGSVNITGSVGIVGGTFIYSGSQATILANATQTAIGHNNNGSYVLVLQTGGVFVRGNTQVTVESEQGGDLDLIGGQTLLSGSTSVTINSGDSITLNGTRLDGTALTAGISGSFSGSFYGDGSGLTGISSASLENVVFTNLGDGAVQLVDGTLKLSGDIIAENYIISSSVTYMTQSFSSGSTVFGDSTDDTHQFTGSILVTGSSLNATLNDFDIRTTAGVYKDNGTDTVFGVYGNALNQTFELNLEPDATYLYGRNGDVRSHFGYNIIGVYSSSVGLNSRQITAINDNGNPLLVFSSSIDATGSVWDLSNVGVISGSVFSGSFVGDGSGLTGISSTDTLQTITDNGAVTTNNVSFSGSVSITGSGLTMVDNAPLNFGNNATIDDGSQGIRFSHIDGAYIELWDTVELKGGGSGTVLTLDGSSVGISGSATQFFAIKGFRDIDATTVGAISGSVFSGSFVGDGSGLTGITAEWDGSHSGSAVITGSLTLRNTTSNGNDVRFETLRADIDGGTNSNLHNFPTASWDGLFVDYTIVSASNARAGQLFGTWDQVGNVTYTEVSTTDIGNTSAVTMSIDVQAGTGFASVFMNLSNATGLNWRIKTNARAM